MVSLCAFYQAQAHSFALALNVAVGPSSLFFPWSLMTFMHLLLLVFYHALSFPQGLVLAQGQQQESNEDEAKARGQGQGQEQGYNDAIPSSLHLLHHLLLHFFLFAQLFPLLLRSAFFGPGNTNTIRRVSLVFLRRTFPIAPKGQDPYLEASLPSPASFLRLLPAPPSSTSPSTFFTTSLFTITSPLSTCLSLLSSPLR